MRYTTTLLRMGNNTGIEVPPEVLEALGGGGRPAVRVVVNGYEFVSTVGARGGRALVPFSAERRAASGLSGGDPIDVTLELDTAPRSVAVPDDLSSALEEAGLTAGFAALSPSARKAHVLAVEGAKTAGTRERRVAAVVSALRG